MEGQTGFQSSGSGDKNEEFSQGGFQQTGFSQGGFQPHSSDIKGGEMQQTGFQATGFSQGGFQPTSNTDQVNTGFQPQNSDAKDKEFQQTGFQHTGFSQGGFQPISETKQGMTGFQPQGPQEVRVNAADLIALREAVDRAKESLATANELLRKLEFLPSRTVDASQDQDLF